MKRIRVVSKVLVIVFLCLVFGTQARLARASSGYPLNGSLDGGLSNWYSMGGVVWDPAGRLSGTLRITADCADNYGCGAMTRPFTVGSPNSTLGFYSKSTGQRHIWKIDVLNHTMGTYSNNVCAYDFTESDWTYHSCVLSGFAGKVVSLKIRDTYNGSLGTLKVTDFDIDYASNADAALPPYINGLFNTGVARWVGFVDNARWGWTSATGHNQLGAAKYFGYGAWAYALSYPVILDSNTWSMCFSGDAGQTGVKIDIGFVDWGSGSDNGYRGFNDTTVSYDFHTGWTCFGVDPSLYWGHIVSWRIGIYSGVNSWIYTDDWCPMPGGCLTGTNPGPTSTPGPTGTPFPTFPPYPTPLATWTPNVYPTPPPQFTQVPYPTPPPYPTFPPFPTYPWEAGTPMPVTFAGTPQPVFLTTPIVFPTPLATWTQYPTRLATWTAVPTATNTPTITPASQPTVGLVVLGSNNVGRNFLNGNLPVNVNPLGPDRSNDIATGHYDVMQLAFCIPGDITRIATWLAGCYDIPVWSVTQLKILGVDLVPFFATICAVFTLVTIIIRIRNK